jgi:hypothetical protein
MRDAKMERMNIPCLYKERYYFIIKGGVGRRCLCGDREMPLKPFDVWMCTHNSEEVSPIVLPQISRVIPPINRKFIVDDFSSDGTKAVAKSLGWQVFNNKKRGLNNAHAMLFP